MKGIAMNKQIFVNLAVKNLEKSKAFYGALGYTFNPQFSNEQGACVVVSEDSIYVSPDRMGRGIGTALLEALIESSAAYGFRTIVAVIGGAEPASIALHRKSGFREVGRLEKVGFKFGRWLDSLYMQRELPVP